MIKVSIIIPAYNVENEIARCLESCINQTYTNIEIIVVNDGSTDNTLNIVLKLQEKDSRVVILSKHNQGAALARKSGLDAAVGDYIYYLDGDDYIPLGAISSLVEYTANYEYDLVIGNYYQKLVNFNRIRKVKNLRLCNVRKKDVLSAMVLGSIPWSLCFKLIRRSYFLEINVKTLSLALGEDGYVMLQLIDNNPKIRFVNDFIYYYFNRSYSSTQIINSKVIGNRIVSYYYFRDLLNKLTKLPRYVYYFFDLKFHVNNFHEINLLLPEDTHLLNFKVRMQSPLYSYTIFLLVKIKKCSPSVFNLFTIILPSMVLKLQNCFRK